jgi:signal transduction histidine kinase/DNA-binding response OmpR family regulator
VTGGSRPDGVADVFQGGGELGQLMRAFDWASTPLGPVAQWPQSLKTCVRIILTSRQPMFVWWGESLINLYNDAYKSIVGGKHPGALGQPASSVWREIWDQVGPRAEQAMRGNEGTYDEALLLIMERHGYQEETYYTFSYSPVPNERGGTGGIICANTDDTQRIIGERRLTLLRELAARTVDARRPEQACAQAAVALALERRDLPFALVYLTEPGGAAVVLEGAAGLSAGGDAPAPVRIAFGEPSPWPVAEVLRDGRERVVDWQGEALPTGAWPRPPARAVVWPLLTPGPTGRSGVLVAGLNPFRPFDDGYRSFLSLLAGQLSASVANAQAYDEERRRAEALAELDRAKTAFFSNVSHEFRTPLTLMLAPQEDALASPERALAGESLEAVHRNTLRLLKLVNNLLDFSRIEAGRAQVSYRPTDLASLTTDLASAFRSAIERGGVQFDVSCAPLSEAVFVDRALWETIVLNLLSNAFKFTLTGRITLTLGERDRRVELRVSDTGVGIPAHELPRMFERFHRIETPEARTHEGSGIGLALVAELVKLHGGEIGVASEAGEGTIFTVSLPLGHEHLPATRVSQDEAAAPARGAGAQPFVQEALRWVPDAAVEPGAPVATAASSSAHILVADDNADMRDYLARLLRPHWNVTTTSNGVEALAAASARRPDLILTDAMMPSLDGFGLLRAVRVDDALARVPVIMLSARAGEEARVEGLEAGADDYLVKPFQAKELLARVRAHLETARLRQVVETERNRLRSLLGQLPAIVNFLRGPELVLEFAHPLTVARLGGRELLGKPLVEAVPEFRDQEYPRLLRRVIETGERLEGREQLVRLRDGSGELRDTYWSFVYLPVRDDAGRVEGVMTFDLEVTEQVAARSKIEEQTAALEVANREAERARAVAETANRAKDEFLAMLGHELRNPLSPILTALQLLRMRGAETREQAVIERQVGHLVRLVDDLLDISRVTRGKIELQRQPMELGAAVASGIEMARPLLEQRRQRLDLSVPPEGLLVEADANRLAQIVANLLTNAAKYSDPDSTITIAAERRGDVVRLSVRDEGVGIAPELLDRVFDIFFQEPQSIDRSKGGLGLGLAIVHNLVALHGGRVSARSEGLARGSEFVVELPALAGDDVALPTGRRSLVRANDELPVAAASKRVLIVDDNVDAADALAELLQSLGYEAKAAHDAFAALELAPSFRPDVCLLDIGLPVMDGYELAARLRSASLVGDDTRIIAVTGYGQDGDRRRARDAGFDAHVVKPVSLDALTRAME